MNKETLMCTQHQTCGRVYVESEVVGVCDSTAKEVSGLLLDAAGQEQYAVAAKKPICKAQVDS